MTWPSVTFRRLRARAWTARHPQREESTVRRTLFRAMVLERGWGRFATFDVKFGPARDALAGREREPGFHRVSVSRRTFERWVAGDLGSLPCADTCRVLEHMFGVAAVELFASPPACRSRAKGKETRVRTLRVLPSVSSPPAWASPVRVGRSSLV